MHRLDGNVFPIDADVRLTGANICTLDRSVLLIDVERGRIDVNGSLTSSNGSSAHDNERRIDRGEISSRGGDPRSSDNARRTHRGFGEPHANAAATGTSEWLTDASESRTSSHFAPTRTNNVARHRNVLPTRANISESHHNFSDTHANIFDAPGNRSFTHPGQIERHARSARRPSIAGDTGRGKTVAIAVRV